MTDQQNDGTHTPPDVVELASRRKKAPKPRSETAEQMQMILHSEKVIEWLRKTADDLQASPDLMVSMVLVVRTFDPQGSTAATIVNSYSDCDDADLALLERGKLALMTR